jgi:nitroimidazol reductase NimA-like FMN-containing flavoprotein (pyridoxamine 5'-phosphate oxidase superfamily)
MRRKDREISNQTQLRYILDRAAVCHIAFAVENEPRISFL